MVEWCVRPKDHIVILFERGGDGNGGPFLFNSFIIMIFFFSRDF